MSYLIVYSVLVWLFLQHCISDPLNYTLLCVKNMILKNFQPNSSLVVSISSTADDNAIQAFLTSLLQCLENGELFSVTLRNSGTTGCNSSHSNGAVVHYILLLKDVDELVQHLKCLKSNLDWNPRAKFLNVIFPSATVTSSKIKHIVKVFWKLRIVSFVTLAVYYSALSVYTWQPYSKTGACGDADDFSLITVYPSDACQEQLYSFKTDNLNGCPLKILTDALPPFVVMDLSGKMYKNGWEILMLKEVLRLINASAVYASPPRRSGNIAPDHGNGGLFVDRLESNDGDIALGALGVRSEGPICTDMTSSYFRRVWKWYVPCPKKIPRWKSIARVFTPTFWVATLLSFILTTVTLVFVARTSSDTSRFDSWKVSCSSVWAVALNTSSTRLPLRGPPRLLFISWVFFCLVMDTAFQAFLTTFLIDPGFEGYIRTVDELLDSGLPYGYPKFLDHNYDQEKDERSVTITANRKTCPHIDVCISWVAVNRNFSTVYPDVLKEYYVSNGRLADSMGNSLICELEDGEMSSVFIAMSLRKGSHLLDRVNRIVENIVEAGLFQHWVDQSFVRARINSTLAHLRSFSEEFEIIHLENLQSAFCFLSIGLGVALIVFLAENVCFFVCCRLLSKENT